jgi:hypothetical protein
MDGKIETKSALNFCAVEEVETEIKETGVKLVNLSDTQLFSYVN